MINTSFDQTSILIAGDVMLDLYYYGEVHRISPEAPVPVMRVVGENATLGGAANVASNVRHLFGNAWLTGAVGKDANGTVLRKRLDELGIKHELFETTQPTIAKTRLIAKHQQMLRIDFEEPRQIEGLFCGTVVERIAQRAVKQSVLLISDYAKGFCTPQLCQCLIEAANEQKMPTLIDPKGQDWSKYQGALVVTPNLREVADALRRAVMNEDSAVEQAARELIERYDLRNLLVTRSERGMSLVNPDGAVHIPAEARDVYDVSGAGDTVLAVLAVALSAGNSLSDAAFMANKAASIVVGKSGTAPILRDELLMVLSGGKGNRKLCSVKDMIAFAQSEKARGRKVVFTNGCFDILHRGHIEHLRTAKEQGDILLVAINSDVSVRNSKGYPHPINTEMDRAELLSALSSVDRVAIFDGETPLDLIREIAPDVLVKGGNYRQEDIVGVQYAERVIVLPWHNGYSLKELISESLPGNNSEGRS